jgi:hypothetical protein
MRYLVVDSENGKINPDTITEDPLKYVAQFEPIDVVNGAVAVYDEAGGYYHFGSPKDFSDQKIAGPVSIVNVGSWQTGEPTMHKVSDDKLQELRGVLLGFVTTHNSPRHFWKFWLRTKEEFLSEEDFKNLTTAQLFDKASAKLMRKF